MAPLYKPQFAHEIPDGYHDEDFTVPVEFTFSGNGQVQRGLPWQLDDDSPFLIRGIYFPTLSLGLGGTPGKVRIYDTLGNPLTEGLVLSLGMWGSGGLGASNDGAFYAWGFPIEPEILCAPSGVLTFDFEMQTTAFVASTQIIGISGAATVYAGIVGAAGTGRTIALIDPGAPNIALSLVVVGVNVQVTLSTDGASALTTTYAQLVDLLNNSPLTAGIMAATLATGDSSEVVAAMAATALGGGAVSTPQTIKGSFYGSKRLRAC